MLILIVGLAGLLSFGSATLSKSVSLKDPASQERVISHIVGQTELVKQEKIKEALASPESTQASN